MARMADAVHEVPAAWPQSPADLEEILRLAGDAITVQAPDGSLLYANRAAAEQMGFDDPSELVEHPLAEVMARFRILTADGDPFPLDRLPGRRAMLGESGPSEILRFQRIDIVGESLVARPRHAGPSGRRAARHHQRLPGHHRPEAPRARARHAGPRRRAGSASRRTTRRRSRTWLPRLSAAGRLVRGRRVRGGRPQPGRGGARGPGEAADGGAPAHLTTPPPPMSGRRRHVQGGRGRPERHPTIDQLDQRDTASRSELRVSVQPIRALLQAVSPRKTHSLRTGPDVFSAAHNVPGQLS